MIAPLVQVQDKKKTATVYSIQQIVLGLASMIIILASMGLVIWFGVIPGLAGFAVGLLFGLGSLVRKEKPVWLGLVGVGVNLYGLANLIIAGGWATLITTFWG